ncbi:hypothetical protein C0992_005610 [Termitomyces sp. T32_za158]|nr:hypothetical protein C0992_005610 [Termitomyces sp. T32_za158]
MDNLYTPWVHQPSQLLGDQHDADWAKERPSNPPANTADLDMPDFSLSDMPVPSTSATPSQQFFSYQPQNYFAIPAPFNTMAYGSSSWPTATQSHVPLSNYSTLNGATTSAAASTSASTSSSPTASSSQPQQPKQPSSQLQQAIIDPSLTTLNGPPRTTTTTTTSTNLQHYPHANYNAQSSTLPPQQSSSSLSQQQFTYSSLLNSSLYRTPTSYYQSQQQQQQPSQGTLSPQALHAPSSSILGALLPTTFYSQSTSTMAPSPSQIHSQSQQPEQPLHQELPGKTPEERRAEFLSKLRPQLQTTSFSGAGAVSFLADTLREYGATDVDAHTRLEILTRMRDGAGNHYFRAWSENGLAMTITREWLKAAQMADAESPLVETIMPLLHIIDRLPMTLETLKASKLGKIVVKLVKEPRSPDVKVKNLKRKVSDAQTSRPAPPAAKKTALGGSIASSSKSTVVKKEPGTAGVLGASTKATSSKDAKSDSSFFSAPKPKPKLPSFKKAPPAPPAPTPAKAGTPSNVAQPSSVNPFEEALKSMGRSTKRESPAVNTPPSTSETPPQHQAQGYAQSNLTKKGTKKKTVTWAPPGMLERIKLIERAVYDDDPVDGNHTTHTLKDLDRGEGAALHAQIFEETLDWSEPILIDNPVVEEDRPRGSGSQEKDVQEKREQTTLGAVYISPAHIPDSPAEPLHVISEEEVARNMVSMTSGPEVDAVFWSSGPVSPVAQSVAELVGQLASGGSDPALSGAQFNGLKS